MGMRCPTCNRSTPGKCGQDPGREMVDCMEFWGGEVPKPIYPSGSVERTTATRTRAVAVSTLARLFRRGRRDQ